MPTVRVNDITMYYEVHGQARDVAEPMLVIGGLGGDITLTTPLITALAQRYRVLAFDNRGAGRSDKPDMPYTIAMMAGDTLGLLDALSITRVNVLGISMGGRIALELALSHPDRVGKLVLVSTSAAGRGKVVMSWPARLMALLERIGLLRARYPQPDYAHQRQREASTSYNAVGLLSQVSAPTLIAHGRRDRSMPVSMAEEMHAGIAGSRLEVFRGGHMFFLFSERQRLLDRVDAFLGAQEGEA